MRIKLLFFLVIGIHITTAQTNFKKEIYGTWELETITGELKSELANPLIDKNVVFTFKQDDILVIEFADFLLEATYTLEGDELTIGKMQYKITSINKDTLSFKENNKEITSQYTYKRKTKQ
ncbi:hypothetical protein [uncultured Kordia sp.]|uniref:hypothetical protein n=1 Tax=uncultured Kordia sp. TaxID=507699 RepID=UPI0026372F76|nr:hypothetical protein [uncultured Kordia sp.]